MSFGGGAFIGGGGSVSLPIAAANVKHRWIVGPWRTTNLPASTTLAVPYMLASAINKWNVTRACKVVGFSVQTDAAGGTGTPVAGSALTIRVIKVPAGTGTPATGVAIGTVAVGVSNYGSNGIAMTNEVTFAAGDLIQPEVVTDGSWTATSADPGIWLELEEI